MNSTQVRRSTMRVSFSIHTYKYRMAIASKGKGKTGGARVITYNLLKLSDDEVLITLMSIYDKSDIENVSDTYLCSLVKEIESPK